MNSVVIGSGFGGIAAALRLKAKNHKVTLVEKLPDLGGRARVFRRNGFVYDAETTEKIKLKGQEVLKELLEQRLKRKEDE